MPDLLQHAVCVMLNGLLTELPAQLVATAVAAASAAMWRARRRHRVAESRKGVPPSDGQ